MVATGLWTNSKDLAITGIEISKGLKNKSKIFNKKTI
jgi:hypothetical protein